MAAIKAFYVNEGYRQIKIDQKIDWYADAKGSPTDMRLAGITLLIDEGARTRVSGFYGQRCDGPDRIFCQGSCHL